jgi:hypothetical protein
MSQIRRWRWLAGLILGLGPAATPAGAQLLPPALPPPVDPAGLPPLPVDPSPAYSLVRPRPSIVEVPPGGNLPVWRPSPLDPIAMERLDRPKHVEHKRLSWPWRRTQGKVWGYPEEFEPRPLGAAVYESGKIMVANAAEAGLVLHRFDFLEGSTELSPRGGDQLAKMAAQLAVSPFTLIVERTPEDPRLAEARRYAVLARLARGPCPVPSDRVLVGVPKAHGMSGTDAQVIAGNALGRTQQYGPQIPLLNSGVNSASGGSGGASSASGGNGP